MNGHQIGTFVMMRLGPFNFGLDTAAYQSLRRRVEYSWPSQERMGQHAAMQYTGPGPETMTVSGVIFPEFRGGDGQLSLLRYLGDLGEPQLLISGSGETMDEWVIESVDEGQSIFAAAGIPRRQEFTVNLKRRPRAASFVLPVSARPSGGGVAPVYSGSVQSAKASMSKFADQAASQASGIMGTLNGAMASVTAQVQSIGAAAAPIMGNIQRAIGTAQAMRSAAVNLKNSVGGLSSISSIPGAFSALMSASSTASAAAGLASQAAKAAGLAIDGVNGIPAMDALKSAQAACGKAAADCTGIYTGATNFIRGFSL